MATQAILLPTQREKGIFHAKDIPRYTFNAENLQSKKKKKPVLSERSKIWLAKKVTWNNSSDYVLNAFVAYYIAIFAFFPPHREYFGPSVLI